MDALEYLKLVVPEDIVERIKVRGFLRGATIALLMSKYPNLSVEEAYETIYRLTGQVPEKTKVIKMGEFYVKGEAFVSSRDEATRYTEEEAELYRRNSSPQIRKRVEIV